MKVRLASSLSTRPHEDPEFVLILGKWINKDEGIVDIEAEKYQATSAASQEPPYPEERWTLISQIRPQYLAHAVVEIIEPDRGGWKVKLIHTHKPMPRNAQFSRTFTVRRKHLAARA